VELDLNEKVPVATHYVRSYASVLVDDSEDESPTLEIVELDLNEKVPVATHYVRSYASVLVDDSVPQVENVKVDTTSFTINTSNLKSAFWGDEDSDSDEE
jgi:hypothetical protein